MPIIFGRSLNSHDVDAHSSWCAMLVLATMWQCHINWESMIHCIIVGQRYKKYDTLFTAIVLLFHWFVVDYFTYFSLPGNMTQWWNYWIKWILSGYLMLTILRSAENKRLAWPCINDTERDAAVNNATVIATYAQNKHHTAAPVLFLYFIILWNRIQRLQDKRNVKT